jgi:hypothetical protein
MKFPDFSNVMGQFAPRLQELDHQINVLDTQRGEVLQRRLNAILEEFHALVPGIEFGKTVVSYPTVRPGYAKTPIVRHGILGEPFRTNSFSGMVWTLPLTHITKLTRWDHKGAEYMAYPKYNRRSLRADRNSHISTGEEFEIVGEIVRESPYGLYEVKFL